LSMCTAIVHSTADRICNLEKDIPLSTIPFSRYNARGQPVFMVAALGLILDPETNTMKVFGGSETKMVAKNEADDSK
jgi:hypothetical protein